MKHYFQKGVSLYLAIITMTVLLSIVIGTSVILMKQLKIISGMENSIVALYAADSGIEAALRDAFKNGLSSVAPSYSFDLFTDPAGNKAKYEVGVKCCGTGSCVWNTTTNPCPFGSDPAFIDSACKAYYYCIKSAGAFRGTRRAIFVEL